MPLSYLPEAVPTAIGWAHPLTGEQLTAGAISVADLDGATPVAYYKPNAGDRSFIPGNAVGAARHLIQSQTTGRKVRFAVQSLDDVASVAWSFGDRGVASVTVGTPGSGYTSDPTVTFAAAPAGGVTATGVAVRTGTTVTGVTITNPGAGYTSAPTVSFSGGGGTGAAATATLTPASVTGGKAVVHDYPAEGTFDVSAVVSFVGGTPSNATLTINDLVIA